MQLFHSYHKNKFRDLVHSEFWLFELSVWLHVFSRSLIVVFVPIFLLRLDYSLEEVLLFYLLYNIFDVPLNFVARKLIVELGARIVTIFGTIASVFFFVCLFFLTPNAWPILILMAFWSAVYDTFYWVAHLYIFMECSKGDKDVGKDTSILHLVRQIGGVCAPIIGALVLIFFSQRVLTAMSILVLLASVLPLFKITHIKDKPGKRKKFLEFFRHKEDIRNYLSVAFYSAHCTAEDYMWPLFIFSVFETVESVAYLPIIISVTTMVFIYLTGSIKKEKRHKLMAFGGVMIGLVWVLRMYLDGSSFYYFSAFCVGLFSLMISIPLDSSVFERGGRRDALTASTYRNTVSMMVKAIIFLVLVLLVNVFKISFVVASLSMFLLMTVNAMYGVGNSFKYKSQVR